MTLTLSKDFPATGFMARSNGTAVTRFQVVGERSSGTNLVKRLLGRNTDLTPTEALGWKHGFPHATAIPADLAVVVCLRDPRQWSLSMHAKPWHTPPDMQSLEFSDFVRAPWGTIVDRNRYFQDQAPLGILGQALQHDRHPMTGGAFANVFALRQAKLWGHLSYLNRDCNVIVLRMENAVAETETFLKRVRQGLGLPASDAPLRGVHRRLGSKFKPAIETRPETPKSFPAQDLEFMRANLNLDLEKALGYDLTA